MKISKDARAWSEEYCSAERHSPDTLAATFQSLINSTLDRAVAVVDDAWVSLDNTDAIAVAILALKEDTE